jgi:hypothetical protein
MGASAALAIAVSATEARAATIFIDFGNVALYGGANGSNVFATTDQGVGVSLTSSGGTLRQTSEGLGVNGPTSLDDSGEVGVSELLLTGFAPAQFVHSISIEQLFNNDWGFHTEQGQYSINGAAWVSFSATGPTGFYTLNIGADGVNSLGFRTNSNFLNDYSVRGVTLESVAVQNRVQTPEPASMILLGSGLVGAFMQRRRKKSQGV